VVTEVDRQIAGRYTVQSVARALRLVEIVAGGPPGGLSLSELARTLGASKSSTLALARTLVAFGYLRDAYPGPGYTLGTGLIRLGDIVGRQLPLGDLCRPLIEGLSRATEMTSRVAISDQGYPVFVVREDGPGSVRFYTPLGQRELPYASAAGKAILAAMDEEGIRRMCAETGLAPRTAHTITDIGTVGIPVSDQDKAVEFFTGTLGFEKRLDARMGESFRWVTVAAPGASTSVALIARPDTGADTGIRFLVPDAETEHGAMRQRGIEVGDLLRWPGVPPMFEFKDPDGNRFEIVEASA